MTHIDLPEAELQLLISRAQEGDTEAFGRMYDYFFTQVYRYCAFRLPRETAEDVTADIFVKAWEKLHTYKAHKGVPFGAWLFRIARHGVIDTYRSQRGFEELSDAFPDTDMFNRADARIQRNEAVRMVQNALSKLPGRYREILLLTYAGELPHSEVARVLRTSEGSVRILKMRALRKLESFLPPESSFDA